MILQRHLVVADKTFSMADLRAMSNDTIVLPTIRDALTIRVREDGKRRLSMKYVLYLNSLSPFTYIQQVIQFNGINVIFPSFVLMSSALMELFMSLIIHF